MKKKYKTEKHDHEKISKSLKTDGVYYNKKYTEANEEKILERY